VRRTRSERIVREETPSTTDTVLRLARYLGSNGVLDKLQARYDLKAARRDRNTDIAAIEPCKVA
jgi:plasmid maintenance system antidote protein VapI